MENTKVDEYQSPPPTPLLTGEVEGNVCCFESFRSPVFWGDEGKTKDSARIYVSLLQIYVPPICAFLFRCRYLLANYEKISKKTQVMPKKNSDLKAKNRLGECSAPGRRKLIPKFSSKKKRPFIIFFVKMFGPICFCCIFKIWENWKKKKITRLSIFTPLPVKGL